LLHKFKQKRPSLRDREKTYVTKSPEFVFTGMRRDESPIKIQETDLYNAFNIFKKNGNLTKRPGLKLFGNGFPLPNPVMQMEQFFKYDGTEYFVVFTTKDAYLYNTTTGYFDLITESVLVDDCETSWTPVGTALVITDDSWVRYGLNSVKISSATSLDSFNVPMFVDISDSDLERQIISSGLDTDILGLSADNLQELDILPDVALLSSLNVPPIATDLGYDITQSLDWDTSMISAGDLNNLEILPDVDLDSFNIPPFLECDFMQSGHDTAIFSAEDLKNLLIIPDVKMGSGFATGLIAYHTISSKNLSSYSHVHFYIQSDIDLDAGDLQLLLDNTAACASPLEVLDIPALTANTPLEVEIALDAAVSDTAIISVGLRVIANKGACNIWIDSIYGVNCFTGTTDNQFSCDTIYDNDSGEIKFLATNGVDNIKYWNGSGNWADLAGSPNKCKYLKVFYTWLLLLNCIVSGEEVPQRIDWCVPGNPKDWTGSGSGTNTLASSTGEINGCEILRGQLAIFLEESITMMYATGSTPSFTFDENKVLYNGSMAEGSIQSLGESILYLGWDCFYNFDGYSAHSKGSEIKEYFLKRINPAYINIMHSHILEQNNLYLLFFPSTNSTVPNEVLVYDYVENKFLGIWDFNLGITSTGFYHRKDSLKIGELTMTIGEMTWKIGSNVWQSIASISLLGDENGYIYELSDTYLNDNNVAIDSYFDTKSFMPNLGKYSRFVRQQLYATGTQLESSYSVNNGETFNLLTTTTLDNDESEPELTEPFNITNEKIMFRFRNSELNGWFRMTGMQYFYIEKTEEV
jgi:hypothetical protein